MDYNFQIFKGTHTKWTAKAESDLLFAIKGLGHGSWEEIANCIGKDFTAEDVQEHYDNFYVKQNIGKLTWKVENRPKIIDHTQSENGLPYTLPAAPTKTTELSTEQQQQISFLPLRGEFVEEYDNDAEYLFNFLPPETSTGDEDERTLQLAIVDMYRQRLKERFCRKEFLFEHNLVNLYLQSNPKQQKSSSSKKKTLKGNCKSVEEFQEKLSDFLRFFSHNELVTFFENLSQKDTLSNNITHLIEKRKEEFLKSKELNDSEEIKYKINATRKQTFSGPREKDINGNLGPKKRCNTHDKQNNKQCKIASMPGYKMLSYQEQELCASLKLKPSHYIAMKYAFIKADVRKRRGKVVKPFSPCGLDARDYRKVEAFMRNCGWIKSKTLL